jgi:hypothetical protein
MLLSVQEYIAMDAAWQMSDELEWILSWQQWKTRFDDNPRNKEAYRCTECFISGRREASLGQENWPEEEYGRERLDTGQSYRAVEAQSKNKAEEKILGTDLITKFVQGASKSGCAEDCVLLFQ